MKRVSWKKLRSDPTGLFIALLLLGLGIFITASLLYGSGPASPPQGGLLPSVVEVQNP